MASSTTGGPFSIQTSLPTNIPTPSVTLLPSSDAAFSTIDIHSDRPIPTQVSSAGDVFSIETQTSVTNTGTNADGGLFTIQTQTSLTGTVTTNPTQTTPPATTTGASAVSGTSSTVAASNTPSDAGQFGASFGILGFVMLAWMGFFSLRH